jgi:hypothetical protein
MERAMIRILTMTLAAAALLAACDKPTPPGVPAEAQKTADRLTGDAKQAAADNPQCKLFKPAEAAAYIGEAVNAGENAAGGSGCQWSARDGSGDAMLVVVPANYHEVPSLQDGYKPMPDLGEKGFVAPFMDGWLAAAVHGEESVRASVAGNKASADTAIAMLKEAVKRKAG